MADTKTSSSQSSEKFTTITGAAAALLLPNIDTDTIAPSGSEKKFGDLAAGLFANWRYDEKGDENPDFVLNKQGFRESKILLAGQNFACGSSRESAVWMLHRFGIRCVIAPSYGEIFYNNCFNNSVLPIVMSPAKIRELSKESEPGAPDAEFSVDLTSNTLITPSGKVITFEVPKIRRQALLEGLDEISLNLNRIDEITAYRKDIRAKRPWVHLS